MARRTNFGGVIPATITPFTADERINAGAMQKLMDWNMAQGVAVGLEVTEARAEGNDAVKASRSEPPLQ